MASKRDLKKDINYLTDDFLAEGLSLMFSFGEKAEQELSKVMQTVADARNNLFLTLETPAGKGERVKKEGRAEYLKVRAAKRKAATKEAFKGFLTALEKGYEEFSKIIDSFTQK